MARGRRPAGRKTLRDLREEADAVEAREKGEAAEDEEGEAEEEAEAEAEGEGDEEGDEGAPKAKAKAKAKAPKKKAAPKKPTTPRSRAKTQKEVRQRAFWRVFDNSNKPVETFPYNQRAEAEAFLARKQEEKKGSFYLNLVKETLTE